MFRPVDVSAFWKANHIDAVCRESNSGAHAAEMNKFAIDDDVGDWKEVALSEEGSVDGGNGIETGDKTRERFRMADAMGGDSGRHDDPGIIEINVDHVKMDAADDAVCVFYRLAYGRMRAGEDYEESKREYDRSWFQSRMSSRLQPKGG